MIRFDAFSWRFAGASSWALEDVCLHIRRGEFAVVAGPSGSGKTTLALAMCGLLVGRHEGQTRGIVEVAGGNVANTPLHKTAQTIGLVQQNPETHFATLTVADEIAFGMENRCLPREDIRRRSAEAMELLSITHLADRSLSNLSGGEKQRVAVASIIAGGPQALVLDEPTASLDPQASRDLFRALADLCRETGLTVVVIEHKLAHLLPLKPRLISVDGGRVDAHCQPSAMGHRLSPPMGPARAGPLPAVDAVDPIVDFSEVTVEAGGRPILADVSLRVHAGEVVAVLGPNGGGKTTLLHCLLGLVKPVRGSVRVNGLDVARTAVSQLARRVGLVFQNADHQLVADTVWGEALFASNNFKMPEAAQHDAATRLLSLIGLLERREDHPYRLSWGQKRRLNVVSSILHQPDLLLLDEPFAGQDWDNATLLLEAIRGVVEAPPGKAGGDGGVPGPGACLMVTHDPRIVLRSCTRVVFIEGGRIAVDAPVKEAFVQLLKLGRDAYVPTPSSELNDQDPETGS